MPRRVAARQHFLRRLSCDSSSPLFDSPCCSKPEYGTLRMPSMVLRAQTASSRSVRTAVLVLLSRPFCSYDDQSLKLSEMYKHSELNKVWMRGKETHSIHPWFMTSLQPTARRATTRYRGRIAGKRHACLMAAVVVLPRSLEFNSFLHLLSHV